MKVASLILDVPTQALDHLFSYRIPEDMPEAEIGCAAAVSFGNRLAIGFIVGIDDLSPEEARERGIDAARLKPLGAIASKPFFDADGAACALHLSRSCIAPLSTCIRLFTPPGGVPRAVKADGGWRIEQPAVSEVDERYVALTEAGRRYEPRATATRQRAVIEALRLGELRASELRMEFGAVDGVLDALAKKGVIRVEARRRLRGRPSGKEPSPWSYGQVSTVQTHLTAGQVRALAAIREADEAADGRVVLLDGVTGSGKTEVYLQAIEPVIAAGRRVIVLVPEISLTPQTVARFRGRFGDRVAVMHSRMSRGERYDEWDYIRSGAARVVVGARSALFAPVADLGMVIIDEEHESSYKQDSAPRYHAREVARWMVRRRGATLVLGSATPSVESLHACATLPGWRRVALPERANGKPLPPVDVVDMAAEFRGGSRSMFSLRLQTGLIGALQRGEKAMLLLNQRGFARIVLCRECGFVPECPHCATSLTYHEHEGCLLCHHCGFRQPMPPRCPRCRSPYLRLFGAGTQRVEADLRALLERAGLGGARVIRMDADTTRKKGAHQALLEEFMRPGAAVLLGTQMIAKGHDFEDVTLVGVVNADTTLKLPDFRSGEATYDLIEQVAGRAGRGALDGRVVVQTYWADSSAIRAAAAHDRAIFLSEELPKRKALRYPPYARLANILVWGRDAEAVAGEARGIFADIAEAVRLAGPGGWSVLPATPCTLSRLRGLYRWHIIVKAPAGADIAGVIGPCFQQRKPNPEARAAIDIDPLNLL